MVIKQECEQSEMGDLWNGEQWVKSSLVPFGYYAMSEQHLPELVANTSYRMIDQNKSEQKESE